MVDPTDPVATDADAAGLDMTTIAPLIEAGVAARRQGDLDGAELAMRMALQIDPTEPEAVRHLGAMLVERDLVGEAIALFESAVERVGSPSADNVGFYNNYANALRHAGRGLAAEAILREVVASDPEAWQPWHNLGQTLRDLQRFDDAASAMERAISLEPDFGPNHAVLGEILFHLGDPEAALAELQTCVDLCWTTDPGMWSTIGACQHLLGRIDDAIDTLRHAISLAGSTPRGHRNLGVVLSQAGRFDEAAEEFDCALALDPDDPRTHSDLACSLLAAGRLTDAWNEWEFGLASGLRDTDLEVGLPRWRIDDRDARVLVHAEQGLGDELMFASCFPEIMEVAREVVLECDARLVGLMSRSFPDAEIHARPTARSPRTATHGCDCAIPAGSLPQIFRRTIDAFPDRRVVIRADPELVSRWRERLLALGAPPYVGVAWRSRLMTAHRRSSYTRLDEWRNVLSVPGVTWVNLQYDRCDAELDAAEQEFGVRLHRWESLDLMNDLDEVAALTAALDLVVSPRSAVSMLSGSLGLETIAFANRHSWADLGSGRLPWLPAVRMIYREPGGTWAPALSTAAASIAQLADQLTP